MFGTIKPYVPWLATSLLALGLILSNENPQVNTLRNNLSDLIVIGAHPMSDLLKAPRLWKENTQLRRQLAEMSIRLSKISGSAVENERLRRMLGFREKSAYSLIAAEIVGMNPDLGIRGILLNAGSKDGIEIDQAVITSDGVAGLVYRVGKHSCAVQLLTDPNFGAAGRLKSSHEDGIVHAAGSRRLKLDGVPITASVIEGDSVITSGLDTIFPSGLLIGVTRTVEHHAGAWLWEIEVEPAVDFGRLTELFIIRKIERAE